MAQAVRPRWANHLHEGLIVHFGRMSTGTAETFSMTARSISPQHVPVHWTQAPSIQVPEKRSLFSMSIPILPEVGQHFRCHWD